MAGLADFRRLWKDSLGRPEPGKIVCVGLNYHDHAAEQDRRSPEEPLLFAKFAKCRVRAGNRIVLPPESDHVDAGRGAVVRVRDPWLCATTALEVRQGESVETIEVAGGDLYRLEIEAVSAAVRGERDPLLGPEDGAPRRALQALYRSAVDGVPVQLAPRR